MSKLSIPQKKISDTLTISRVLTGLWQVADMERSGEDLDPDQAANQLSAYVRDGFSTFDMADHYGSAEIIAGRMLKRFGAGSERPLAFTKWCPKPGEMTQKIVRAGVQERLDRLGVEQLDLLQFHWWSFEHPAWLDALHELASLREKGLIKEIGVTNFDAAHLHLALADGVPICTNQISCSLIDRRATGGLSQICEEHDVHLLAYGTVCGGFLSEKWLNSGDAQNITDWSKMKYYRFIEAAGGWEAFQTLLHTTAEIATKHDVSVTNVATRWVLEQRRVAGIIIGARLGENEHRLDNAKLFSFELDREDYDMLDEAFSICKPIPGDCGDEYRKPPFLTASGDLSHHLNEIPSALEIDHMPQNPNILRAHSGSKWEEIAGYCRARRIGDRILVSGTTATSGSDRVVASGDACAQTTYILDKIIAAVTALGGKLTDICRTRIYLKDINDTEAVSRAHGRIFGDIRPANTLLAVQQLAGDYLVEIEAEAIITPDD